MEQVIPGSNPEDDSDLIIEAVEYKNRGDYTRAWDVLVYILKLNPMDNQGARFLIPELKAKVPYGESRI